MALPPEVARRVSPLRGPDLASTCGEPSRHSITPELQTSENGIHLGRPAVERRMDGPARERPAQAPELRQPPRGNEVASIRWRPRQRAVVQVDRLAPEIHREQPAVEPLD